MSVGVAALGACRLAWASTGRWRMRPALMRCGRCMRDEEKLGVEMTKPVTTRWRDALERHSTGELARKR